MKQRVEMSRSRSAKNSILAMTQVASMKPKRRAAGRGQDFRSRSFDNLMAKRREVEEGLVRLTESRKKYEDLRSVDPLIEDVDQAEREISAHRHYTILERKHQELKKIDLLIRRLIEDDGFGICEECGRQIPEERLLVVPEAACCVPCQKELEKWNMKGGITETPHPSSRSKNSPGWGLNRQSFDYERSFTLDSDIERISLMDFGEIDFEGPQEGENL